ncbi:YhgE/Pip domain-containing protein [Corynebacterium pyruviciproducens]
MVAGDQVVEKLTGNTEAPVRWTAVDDPVALDEALEHNEYYGAVIIPKDFTASQLAAKAGQGQPAQLQVILDNGKNPMVANSMRAALGRQRAHHGDPHGGGHGKREPGGRHAHAADGHHAAHPHVADLRVAALAGR